MSPREAAFQQYRKISNLMWNLVYQYGEGRDEAHFKGCQETEICLIISVAFVWHEIACGDIRPNLLATARPWIKLSMQFARRFRYPMIFFLFSSPLLLLLELSSSEYSKIFSRMRKVSIPPVKWSYLTKEHNKCVSFIWKKFQISVKICWNVEWWKKKYEPKIQIPIIK